jgi:acetolactate synthase-1/2/3 large subunit
MDIYGNRASEVVVKESDLVITIGEDISENASIKFDPDLFRNCTLISIDCCEIDFGRNYPVELTLCGNIKITIKELYSELKLLDTKPIVDSSEMKQKVLKHDAHIMMEQKDTAIPMSPQVVYRVLNETIDNDCLVLTDTGAHGFWAIRNLVSYENGFMYSATGYSMGQGVAGSIGAKIGQPNKTVLCITGDGGFLMHGMELSTAQQYRISVIWLVMYDERYNMVDWGQKLTGGGCEFCTDLTIPKFDKLAEAFGIQYSCVYSPDEFSSALSSAMKRSRSEGNSSLIVVNYDKDTYLPVKPRAIKILEDIKSEEKIQSNPYLMKAFASLLKERI